MMAVDILRDLKLTSETNLNLVVAPERNSPFGITMYHVGTINVLPKSFYGGKKPSTLLFTFLLLLSISWKLAQFALRRINVMFALIKYPKNVSSRCWLCCTEWSQSDTNTCRVKSDACFCCLQVSGGENAKKKRKKKLDCVFISAVEECYTSTEHSSLNTWKTQVHLSSRKTSVFWFHPFIQQHWNMSR